MKRRGFLRGFGIGAGVAVSWARLARASTGEPKPVDSVPVADLPRWECGLPKYPTEDGQGFISPYENRIDVIEGPADISKIYPRVREIFDSPSLMHKRMPMRLITHTLFDLDEEWTMTGGEMLSGGSLNHGKDRWTAIQIIGDFAAGVRVSVDGGTPYLLPYKGGQKFTVKNARNVKMWVDAPARVTHGFWQVDIAPEGVPMLLVPLYWGEPTQWTEGIHDVAQDEFAKFLGRHANRELARWRGYERSLPVLEIPR